MSATGGHAPGETPAFPWDEALALGLGALGWSPRDLWRATPRELLIARGRPAEVRPLRRADLERLIAAHPDPA
ncbi:phage tail assembly chaperone [uncultured Methylobacterium sp.]|uniref:phage tail assembly chaperone n=1 Tax=uncultured Methylobacterium sp. TaxID=157278 RepID=UPI0035CB43E1